LVRKLIAFHAGNAFEDAMHPVIASAAKQTFAGFWIASSLTLLAKTDLAMTHNPREPVARAR
jgi:hypothetical protein